MYVLFLVCGLTAVLSVLLITVYMIVSGGPAILKIGITDFLLGRTWRPGNGQFGILPLILSSIFATGLAILIAVPIGVCVSVFLTYFAGKRTAAFTLFLIELLAGIPSVVFGLFGAIVIMPAMFDMQKALGIPQGGSLAAAALVLTIMILPTIVSVSVSSIKAVPGAYYDASLALGSSKVQGIFKAVLPAAKSGITAGIVLGVGRAIGETMAVMMVAGNAAILPELFGPVRLLTVGISHEWAYSSGLHRDALYGIGLVLFVFIMIVNLALSRILKKGGGAK